MLFCLINQEFSYKKGVLDKKYASYIVNRLQIYLLFDRNHFNGLFLLFV